MTPQDTRAPFQQQRWIEIENVGGSTIPAFGACEVTDSYRPEQGHYTPNDGRTVLKARLSQIDDPCLSVINGPCAIPPGETRRVGTMHDPMLALVEPSSLPAGTVVGIRKNSFYLQYGYCGYLIIGDYDGGTGTIRVKRWEDCPREIVVKALECIYPGDTTKTARVMRYNYRTKCWEEDLNRPTPVTICDCNKWLLALPDECFKVERMNSCDITGYGGDTCYRPSFPYGLTRRVKIEAEIGAKACGTAKILKAAKNAADCDYPEESECEIQVCNPTGRKIACGGKVAEYATLHINPGECGDGTKPTCYGWIVPDPRAMFAVGKLNDRLCGDETGEFSEVTYKDLCDWDKNKQETKNWWNPLKLYACNGKEVLCTWDDCECRWVIIQVPDEELPYYIRNLRCDLNGGCEMEKEISEKPLYGHTCDCPTPYVWETAFTGVEREVVVNAECGTSDCVINLKTKKICLFCGTFDDGADISLQGTRVTVASGLDVGSPVSMDMDYLTGAKCSDCSLEFGKGTFTSSTVSVKLKTICVLCADETDAGKGDGFTAINMTVSGAKDTITGTNRTVVTNVGCDSCGLVLTTVQICDLCGSGTTGQIAGPSGTMVTAVTDVGFTCDPCPKVEPKGVSFCALCVAGSESPIGAQAVECTCVDCEET